MQELNAKARASAFEKFCTKVELPDLTAKTVDSVREQLVAAFSDGDVTIKANKEEKSLAVEVALAEGTSFRSEIKVRPVAPATDEEQDVVLKFISCPVCLPGDPELIWGLAKRENMTPEEAALALAKVEEDFWASKSGQKMLRDRVDRCFPEFMARAPGGMFTAVGLKRHYKLPEALKTLRPLAEKPAKKKSA